MTSRAWLLSCYNTSTVSIPQTSVRDWRPACLPACSTCRSCLRNIYIAACPPLSVPSSHAKFDQNVNIHCGLLWRYRNSTGFLKWTLISLWGDGIKVALRTRVHSQVIVCAIFKEPIRTYTWDISSTCTPCKFETTTTTTIMMKMECFYCTQTFSGWKYRRERRCSSKNSADWF